MDIEALTKAVRKLDIYDLERLEDATARRREQLWGYARVHLTRFENPEKYRRWRAQERAREIEALYPRK